MDSLIFSLNTTIPIFLVIILGYILMRVGFFNEEFTRIADKYVFKVALPVMLFKQIATADIHSEFDIKFVLFCMGTTTVMFFLVWLMGRIFLKDKSMVGAFAQASARSSAAILGIAFIEDIYGSCGMGPLMIVSAVPLYNIYSVIILTFNARDREQGKNAIKKAFISILKNPIIIAIFLGLPFSIIGIRIPTMPLKAISMVAQTGTPVALLVVGATFQGKQAISKIGPTIAATFIKLIGLPLMFLPIAVSMGFRNEALVAIIVMLGSPTTVTSYIMAKNMGNDEVLSSGVVVLSTLFSSVTLTVWIFILKAMNWI
ncbi:MAG: AEC family transporter [Butyrivibrio sp.]